MRHLRICIGEIICQITDITQDSADYYLIDTYTDRTLGVVIFCTDNSALKMQRKLETKYGILVTEHHTFKSQYQRQPHMHVLHCRIVEEEDTHGF